MRARLYRPSRGRWAAILLLAGALLAAACGLPPAPRAGDARPADAGPWRFAFISDTQGDNKDTPGKSGLNDAVAPILAAAVAAESIDFLLVSGDLVSGWFRNGGTDYDIQHAHWRKAFQPVFKAGIRVYPIRGNHDDGPERIVLPPLKPGLEPPPGSQARIRAAFLAAFPEPFIPGNGPAGEKRLTYSFFHKNALLAGLDQFAGGQHRVSQAWLDARLKEAAGRHVFVYGHEPAFETNHKDNLACFPDDRDRFWDSLGEAGARVYLCGHDHFYNRAVIEDGAGRPIRQIIAGTGGGPLKEWKGVYGDPRVRGEFHDQARHGYLLVTVDGPRATIEWKALVEEVGARAWRVLDAFGYSLLPSRRTDGSSEGRK